MPNNPMVISISHKVLGTVYGLLTDPTQISKGVTNSLEATQSDKVTHPLSFLWSGSVVDDISLTFDITAGGGNYPMTPGINSALDVETACEKIIKMGLSESLGATKSNGSSVGIQVVNVSVSLLGSSKSFFSQNGLIVSASYKPNFAFDSNGMPISATVTVSLRPSFSPFGSLSTTPTEISKLPNPTNFKLGG